MRSILPSLVLFLACSFAQAQQAAPAAPAILQRSGTSQEIHPSIARHVTKAEAAASAASAAEKAKKTKK